MRLAGDRLWRPYAFNCVECNAKAMIVVRLCACGNKRRPDSEKCRACYTAAIKPARAKRHDLCACGTKKRKESEQCAACFKRSQRAKVDTHTCGCGAPIPLAVTRCVTCREKTKDLHTCNCGKPKSPKAERCMTCRRVTETGRHDMCACGARKLKASPHCRHCGQLSRRKET